MKPFHITCVMHNSRTSIRMFNYKVKNGIAEYLTIAEEEKLLEIICDHVHQYKLSLLSFNICGDHIHFVINEESLYLNKVIGRLKSISSREFNIWRGITIPNFARFTEEKWKHDQTRGHAPLSTTESKLPTSTISRGETQNSLWAQKFNRVEITSETQLLNTLKYIAENRVKHQLKSLSEKATKLIDGIISENRIQFL